MLRPFGLFTPSDASRRAPCSRQGGDDRGSRRSCRCRRPRCPGVSGVLDKGIAGRLESVGEAQRRAQCRTVTEARRSERTAGGTKSLRMPRYSSRRKSSLRRWPSRLAQSCTPTLPPPQTLTATAILAAWPLDIALDQNWGEAAAEKICEYADAHWESWVGGASLSAWYTWRTREVKTFQL